jgi:hypothetical protein
MRRPWTAAEIGTLRATYANLPDDSIGRALDRSPSAIANMAVKLGLHKSEAVKAQTRFKPGQCAWNKGLKGVVGVQEACRATQFKPGRLPQEARNYQPIGTLRVNADGLLERKTTDDLGVYPARRWRAVHLLVWEAENGPLPPGHIVVFKPGRKTTDPEQITADAVECISRAENMRRNTYHRYGPEVAKLIQLRGAITRQINKRAKNEQDHQ